MKRMLPYPLLSAFLFAMWLLLAPRVTPGQVVLGFIVAIAGGLAMGALRLQEPVMRKPIAAMRLAFRVSVDIMRSNIAVARIILSGKRESTSGFLILPLEMKDPTALAILAVIITATPGTIWVSYDRRTGRLLLHILDLVDEDAWMRTIKGRYEARLMEIFE